MTPPIPAIIDCPRGDPRVLAKRCGIIDGNQPVLIEGETFQQIGSIRDSKSYVDGKIRTVWRAYDMRGNQLAISTSKHDAIDLLLAALDVYRVEPDDTMPDLLAGL